MFRNLLACSSTGSCDFPSVMMMATLGKLFLDPAASVKVFFTRYSIASPGIKIKIFVHTNVQGGHYERMQCQLENVMPCYTFCYIQHLVYFAIHVSVVWVSLLCSYNIPVMVLPPL